MESGGIHLIEHGKHRMCLAEYDSEIVDVARVNIPKYGSQISSSSLEDAGDGEGVRLILKLKCQCKCEAHLSLVEWLNLTGVGI